MDGRWTINQMKMGLGWNASVGGPITNDLPMPIVPCDDAAIERGVEAARRRHQEWFNRRLRGDVGGEWLDSEDFADLVEDILRAAGETP